MNSKITKFLSLICLVLIIPMILCFSGCSKNNSNELDETQFEHKKIEYVMNNNYKINFQLTNISKGIIGTNKKCIDFEITVENLMPSNYIGTAINLTGFDFYFLKPQTVYEIIMFENSIDEPSTQIIINSNSTKKINLRVVYHELNEVDITKDEYVLKLLGNRI